MSTPPRLDKARGLLFGLALGDCLGTLFEHRTGVTEADIVAAEHATEPLAHTDDTALTLVLARHLAHRTDTATTTDQVVEVDVLAREFTQAWEAEPGRGYGKGVTRSFQLISEGVPWREAIRAVFPDGSFGNGGAMRVAPVALAAANMAEVVTLARRSTEVTHAHADGLHGAVCQAVAAHLALALTPGEAVDPRWFVDRVRETVSASPWQEKLHRVAELAEAGAQPEHAATVLGNDVAATGSVPLALLSFLRHPAHPEAAIRYAIRAGGDTDTIAAMAGALAGAHGGFTALRSPAANRLEAADQLHHCAEHLARSTVQPRRARSV